MDEYKEVIESAIEREREVLGKEAISQVNDIEGIKVDDDGNIEELTGNGREVLNEMVDKYEEIAGNLAEWLIARKLKADGHEEVDLPDRLEDKM